MASPYWIFLNSTPDTLNYSETAASYQLLPADYERFSQWLRDPPISTGIFGSPTNWLSSMVFFPFPVDGNGFPTFTSRLKVFVYDPKGVDGEYVYCRSLRKSNLYNIGCVKYTPKFGNFVDYSQFTKISLYLPYYGFVPLSPEDVNNKYISIFLYLDALTGMGTYIITAGDADYRNLPSIITWEEEPILLNRILATYNLQFGYPIPIGSNGMSEIYGKMISIGTNAILAGASAMTGIPLAGLSQSTQYSSEITKTRSEKTGRLVQQEAKEYEHTTQAQRSANFSEIFANSMDALHFTPSCSGSPSYGALAGAFTSQCAKIVRYSPRYVELPSSYNHIYGKPNGTIQKLGEIWGYTEISSVHIEGNNLATISGDELSILENEIRSGIILPSTDFTLDDSLTLQFTAGGKQTWKNWINSGGDASQIFADTHFDYDAQKVYVTILNVRYHLESGGNIVRYFDDIKSQNYDIVEEI